MIEQAGTTSCQLLFAEQVGKATAKHYSEYKQVVDDAKAMIINTFSSYGEQQLSTNPCKHLMFIKTEPLFS